MQTNRCHTSQKSFVPQVRQNLFIKWVSISRFAPQLFWKSQHPPEESIKTFFAKFRKLFPSTFSTSKCAEKTLMETVTHTFQLFHSITIICNLLQGNVFMWQQLIMCINKRSLIVILCWSVIIILNISWVSWVKQGSDLQWIEMECEIKS